MNLFTVIVASWGIGLACLWGAYQFWTRGDYEREATDIGLAAVFAIVGLSFLGFGIWADDPRIWWSTNFHCNLRAGAYGQC